MRIPAVALLWVSALACCRDGRDAAAQLGSLVAQKLSLRPASSPNRTYLWFCLSAVCFWMPQTLGMVKATQSPWKT